MLFLRRVSGKSLEPDYQHGRLVVGISARQLRLGQVVVFKHEGCEKIKRVTDIADDKIFVEGTSHYSSDSRDFGWIQRSHVRAVVIWPRSK